MRVFIDTFSSFHDLTTKQKRDPVAVLHVLKEAKRSAGG